MPRPRFRGGYPGYFPPLYETQVIEVDRTGPALPWRVISTTSWGRTTHFQGSTMQAALVAFKAAVANLKKTHPFNTQLDLQHWNGNGWQSEAGFNSTSGWTMGQELGDSAVSEGVGLGTFIMAAFAIIGVYYFL